MKKEVLIIFKTHLDIGFTDFSQTVMDNYLNVFIPNAIRVGNALKNTKTPFIWTVGSWLVWEALKRDTDGSVEQAIKDGIITWHGLPFTTHTELMNKELFAYGLSLSMRLDARFGRNTIGAKMTDVPGHTIGMVPMLRENGVEFLHIGVNPATPNPKVPPVFRWKADDSEIVVMYEDGYGKNMEFEDFVVCFGHTNDNMGPQSAEEILEFYRSMEEKYPDCEIKAATLNDVAQRVRNLKDLPVVDQEIGDTWIHGAGTDPKKVGMYRELLRHIEENGVEDLDLADNLLLVPEHTWGKNLMLYFKNIEDWFYQDFQKTVGSPERVDFEKSWEEQRNYVKKAEQVLGVTADYTLKEPDLHGFEEIPNQELGFTLSWQLFDHRDYTRYMKNYLTFDSKNSFWASWDYLKVGLPDYEGGIYDARAVKTYQNGDCILTKLAFEEPLATTHGLPYFWVCQKGTEIEVQWFGKKANRLPQAFWLKFLGQKEDWQIRKMGRWISPDAVIGSPLIMATDFGVKNGETCIQSLDACLVAPFGRRLLDFEAHPQGQDLYFNLYNNIWNTNFPMWYSDDTRFRFVIQKEEL
ncbi:MAG: DUF5054 domain-containing protein [Clostridia bacterium]|nr:DUF5054 domain-containing protein [Clostridia bacterium]